MRKWLVLVWALFAFGARAQPAAELALEPPECWREMDLEPLNAMIVRGLDAGETWPNSPMQITLEIFGDDTDARALILWEEKNRTEGADLTRIQRVIDGLLDDSVRGGWLDLVFKRQADRTWRLVEARAAQRCYRVEDTETYRADPCP